MDRFDWDKLRVFRAVASSGSISGAARELGESPPTISRKIDDLEDHLNAVLLTRSTKGVELTDAGQKTMAHAEAMADAALALNRDVADTEKPTEGKIKIVSGDGLGAHWIAPRLPLFHKAFPKIQIELNVSDNAPNFLNNEADIAIQFSEPRQSDLIARKLGTLHYMCFASKEYIETYGQPASIFDFHKHRCIFHQGYVNQLQRWPGKTPALTKILDYALVTNSGSVMLEVCGAGGGIAVLPSYVAELNPDLIALDIPEVAPIQFWLSYTERVRRLTRGQVVLDWLRDIFEPRQNKWFRATFIHPYAATEEAIKYEF